MQKSENNRSPTQKCTLFTSLAEFFDAIQTKPGAAPIGAAPGYRGWNS